MSNPPLASWSLYCVMWTTLLTSWWWKSGFEAQYSRSSLWVCECYTIHSGISRGERWCANNTISVLKKNIFCLVECGLKRLWSVEKLILVFTDIFNGLLKYHDAVMTAILLLSLSSRKFTIYKLFRNFSQ